MKRFLALVLMLCLVLGIAAEAFAAGKPEFVEHPKSATTNKKGTVSFSVKVKANGAKVQYSWYFVNPATGEKVSGKKLSGIIKTVKVSGPNSKKITLKKVPEEMHGWIVYCHLNGNGYKVDSNPCVLNVYGKDPAPEPESIPETTDMAETSKKETASGKKDTSKKDTSKKDTEAQTELDPEEEEVSEEDSAEPANKEITVTSSSKVLYKLSASADEAGVSSMTFIDNGSFAVRSDYPIRSWTVNGVKFEPPEPVNSFKVQNITSDTTVNLNVIKPTAASATVDESVTCSVSCEGCSFTYFPKGLISVGGGDVPSGAVITVFTSETGKGFSVNGAEPEYVGKASCSIVITEDTVITMK